MIANMVFIPGKSCTTQLLEVLDYIGSLLDGGKQTDVVYMDMSKAFDKVHQRITRKNYPIKDKYKINNKSLVVTEKEKDLGIWITDTLSWSYLTRDRCAKANKMLGFLRRAATEITDIKIRRTLYLSIVR
jgi:hypothetical protein